jgi:hypothetical protein
MGPSSVDILEEGIPVQWMMVLQFAVVAVVATRGQLTMLGIDILYATPLERYHTCFHCSLLDSNREQRKTCAEKCTAIVPPSDISSVPVLPMDNLLWYCW